MEYVLYDCLRRASDSLIMGSYEEDPHLHIFVCYCGETRDLVHSHIVTPEIRQLDKKRAMSGVTERGVLRPHIVTCIICSWSASCIHGKGDSSILISTLEGIDCTLRSARIFGILDKPSG